jgi:hypothetical protein
MNNLSVDLAQYQYGAQFDAESMSAANLSPAALGNLVKALEAGSLQGGDLSGGQTNGGALKTESLDKNLKLIQFRESDIRFWKRITKSPAYNTVEEYNQLVSYGSDRGGFNREGELPEEEDSQYRRAVEHVKYLGVTKSVTHQMQLVSTNIGSVIQRETTNGILWILRKANRALFHGDAAQISEEYNGLNALHMNNPDYSSLEQYHASDVVIDLRGKSLRERNLESGSLAIINNYGHADLLVAPPVVLSDFAANFYAQKRFNINEASSITNATVGQYISKFQSTYGLIDFDYDIFAARPAGKPSTNPATSAKAPAVPVAGTAPAAVTDGLTRFGDGAGNYYYAVSAINRYGESALVQLGGTIAVTSTQAIDLTFTPGAGAYTTESYRVYRSVKNPTATYAQSIMYPIFDVPATGTTIRGSLVAGVDGAATGSVRDRNRFLTAVEDAWLMQSDSEVLEFKQLAPLMKMPIAKLGPSDRFMILLYGTPLLYTPKKIVRFLNVGRDIS